MSCALTMGVSAYCQFAVFRDINVNQGWRFKHNFSNRHDNLSASRKDVLAKT